MLQDPREAPPIGVPRKWSELPAARRRLVYGAIALGLVLGGLVATGKSRPVLPYVLRIAGYALPTLLCLLRAALYWMERQHTPVPRFVFVCVLLLALIFAGLTCDAIVSFDPR